MWRRTRNPWAPSAWTSVRIRGDAQAVADAISDAVRRLAGARLVPDALDMKVAPDQYPPPGNYFRNYSPSPLLAS